MAVQPQTGINHASETKRAYAGFLYMSLWACPKRHVPKDKWSNLAGPVYSSGSGARRKLLPPRFSNQCVSVTPIVPNLTAPRTTLRRRAGCPFWMVRQWLACRCPLSPRGAASGCVRAVLWVNPPERLNPSPAASVPPLNRPPAHKGAGLAGHIRRLGISCRR